MLNILSVISKDELNNDYYQIEHCGIYDSCVSNYYVVLPKKNFDKFCEMLGAESQPEKRDILNKINLNQIKPIILEELDTVHDSITGHLCDIYEDEDGMLEHYGLIEPQDYVDDFGDFDEPAFGNIDFIPDEVYEEQEEVVVDEPVVQQPVKAVKEEPKVFVEPEKPVVKEIIEIEKVKPEPKVEEKVEEKEEIVESPQETGDDNLQKETAPSYNNMMEEARTKAIYNKALEILVTKLGLDYEELLRQAECEVATEENPDFTLEEVHDALDLLLEYKSVTDFECEFIINMYNQGNVHEVTQLLASKIDLLGGAQ